MASVQSVWGIDVGRCALKAIHLRPAGDGKVEILGHEYVEHAKILTQPDADRSALIGGALEKFLSHNDISKDQVVVSVPGQQTLARFTKLPPVAAKRIPDIVRYEADQQIPFDMDEVIWDYQVFQQEGVPDPQVGIFAMKRELIREHLLHFEQAAIEPIAVQCGPLAVYNAALFDGLLGEDTTILLDIGAENTDLVIATADSFWTRTVPVGGNKLTEALVKSFKLSFSKAESLKRTAATSKYARQIFQAMRPVFADLVQELQRSVGFYTTNRRDARVEKVVAAGNGFLLPGLQKYLQQNLNLAVERPDAFKNAISSPAASDESFKEQLLSFAVAYGLALQGLGMTKVTSNLLPMEIAKQATWRKKRPAFAAAAACLVLAGGLIWFRQASDMSALAASSAGIESVVVRGEDANRIIENGPPASDSPRAKAQAVLLAGQEMKKQLSRLSGQGNREQSEAEELIAIQRSKSLVPGILQAIHEAVPVEEGALAQAKTQAEMLEAIARGDVPPRGERKTVTIEFLDMRYEPDLRLYTWDSVIDVPPPINDHDIEGDDELPGIYVKIRCTTPNSGGLSFIRDTFMESLRSIGRRPGEGFYFDHIIVYEGAKVEGGVDSGGLGTRSSFGRGGGTRGGGSDVDPLTLDVVTNESILDDWEFEVWADVIMENLPDDLLDEEDAGDEGEEYEDEGYEDDEGAEDYEDEG